MGGQDFPRCASGCGRLTDEVGADGGQGRFEGRALGGGVAAARGRLDRGLAQMEGRPHRQAWGGAYALDGAAGQARRLGGWRSRPLVHRGAVDIAFDQIGQGIDRGLGPLAPRREDQFVAGPYAQSHQGDRAAGVGLASAYGGFDGQAQALHLRRDQSGRAGMQPVRVADSYGARGGLADLPGRGLGGRRGDGLDLEQGLADLDHAGRHRPLHREGVGVGDQHRADEALRPLG